MKKKFTTLQLFSIVDGRLSTEMGDVYDMLNHICSDNLMTHHLPVAMDYLESKRPNWYIDVERKLNDIKDQAGDIAFPELMELIELKFNDTYEVPQLKDEFDTSDFLQFMLNNSLLSRIGADL